MAGEKESAFLTCHMSCLWDQLKAFGLCSLDTWCGHISANLSRRKGCHMIVLGVGWGAQLNVLRKNSLITLAWLTIFFRCRIKCNSYQHVEVWGSLTVQRHLGWILQKCLTFCFLETHRYQPRCSHRAHSTKVTDAQQHVSSLNQGIKGDNDTDAYLYLWHAISIISKMYLLLCSYLFYIT